MSDRLRFNKDNVSCVPNSGGIYKFYDKNNKLVYVGRAKGNTGKQWGPEPQQRFKYGLRHRLQSYYQSDDRKEHPTKPALRRDIHSFSYQRIPSERERREVEKRLKQKLKHNHL